MPWKRAVDPLAPTPPRVHSPTRCMNCGCEESLHDADVGCTVDGGTKYIVNDEGKGIRACSCPKFVPAPENPSAAGASQKEV